MTADQPQLGPVQSQERIILLDVLRAVAILGMFYVNFGGGYAAPDPGTYISGGFQGVLSKTILVLTIDKSWSLFAILMGVGMAVFLQCPLTSTHLTALIPGGILQSYCSELRTMMTSRKAALQICALESGEEAGCLRYFPDPINLQE